MGIEDAIRQIKERGSNLRPSISLAGIAPMVFSCTVPERGAGVEDVACTVQTCPEHLRKFWQVAAWAKLFEDRSYGQWGLHILTPQEAREETCKHAQRRPKTVQVGDLVVGRFLGDSDLLIVRCDDKANDFGEVLIALPLDPRQEWYHAAESFERFLEKYLDARGDKYWEQVKR